MKYKIVNSPSVKTDVEKAVYYYRNISPVLAKQFIERIREAKIYIEQIPLGFQEKYKNVRTLLLKQFPYHIHYIIDDTNAQIIILAIIHAYQKPTDFSKR